MSENKKILVIEDDQGMVTLLESRFKANGYRVLTALDGMSGLEKARKESPDLITLDIMLPQLNGYSICGFLKEDQICKSIPIIMITSRQGENDQAFSEEVRPEAYFTKPFNMNELLDKMAELIEVRR